MPGAARARPRAAARVSAQLRHGLRAAGAVQRGAARPRAGPGGSQRPGHRGRVADRAGRHRAEADPAGDLRARLRRDRRSPRPGARARPPGRRRFLRLEPVRGRAAHHRPVGAATRLRRPAPGISSRHAPGRGAVALDRAAVPVAGARGDRRVRGDGDHRPSPGPRGGVDQERSPGGHRAGRPGRGQPAVADSLPAAHGVRGPGGRGRVRGTSRHAVRQPRQPADAGRRMERADGAEGLRRGVVGAVAGGGDRRPGRLPGQQPDAPLARARRRRGRRAADRLHWRDRGRPGPAQVGHGRLARRRRAARRPAVRGAARPGRGRRIRRRRGLGDEAQPVRSQRAETGSPGRRGPARSGPRGSRAAGAGAAAARSGLGSRRTAQAGLVPGGMAGRRARDRRQPGPRRRAAAALGDLPHAVMEPRRGGVRSLVPAAIAAGDLERRDPGRRRAAGAGRPARAAAGRRNPRRRPADRDAGCGRGEVRAGRRGRPGRRAAARSGSSW